MRRFRFIDHTGDAGVRIYGGSLPDLFCHAAEALFQTLTEPRRIRETVSREISVAGNSLEELLVSWLNEFLFLFDTEGMLFRRFEIGRLTSQYLKAKALGEVYEEGRHPIKTLIKAATYHRLEIRQDNGIWKAQIIFDL